AGRHAVLSDHDDRVGRGKQIWQLRLGDPIAERLDPIRPLPMAPLPPPQPLLPTRAVSDILGGQQKLLSRHFCKVERPAQQASFLQKSQRPKRQEYHVVCRKAEAATSSKTVDCAGGQQSLVVESYAHNVITRRNLRKLADDRALRGVAKMVNDLGPLIDPG